MENSMTSATRWFPFSCNCNCNCNGIEAEGMYGQVIQDFPIPVLSCPVPVLYCTVQFPLSPSSTY